MASKIVVVGDVNGRIQEVFSKIATLHTKQNFAFAIIAGNLCSETPSPDEETQTANLINGNIEIALPTYFALGTRPLPIQVTEKFARDEGELCPNLYVLGRKVSIKTAEGFRIVAVGGSYRVGEDEPMNPFEATYSDVDVQVLTKEATTADLLITSDWPAAVRDGAKAGYSANPSPKGVQSIAELCAAVKPRYHFSTSPFFYEREPFFHAGERPQHVTRFLSLAAYGNPDKQKWIYAFSLEPSADPPAALPAGCTASPFNSRKRKLDSQQDSYNNFRYANDNGGGDHHAPNNNHRRKRRQPPPTPDQCFFCLSNPACEAHMIGSIGEESYVAVAKGPLTTNTTYSELDFPGHMLLIPLQHSPTIATIPEKEARQKTVKELQRYRSALHDMLVKKTADPETGRSKLGAVTWEISRGHGIHLHWQFLPIPVDQITRGLVEAAFDVECDNLSYPKFAKTSSAIAEAEEGDYLKVMIWSEAIRKEMVLPIDQSYRFDLQFPRKVFAKLLGLLGRIDWRACAQTKAEEETDANKFKEAFREFDFSLEE